MLVARRTTSSARLVSSLVLLAAAASCGGGGGDGPTGPGGGGSLVSQISLSPGDTTISVGRTVTFTAQPKDAAGALVSGQTITWSSSDATIAAVTGGVVTGGKVGSATITAATGSATTKAVVTVVPAVAGIVISPNPDTVVVTRTSQLTATLRDASGTVITGRTISWSSDNDNVASVSSTGLVTAKTIGTAKVTAVADGQTASAVIVVRTAPVASVTVSGATDSLSSGQTRQLTATVKDDAGTVLTDRVVTWSSSDTSVVTVSSTGLATAQGGGSATITAASEGKTGQITLSVRPLPVDRVIVSPATATVTTGSTMPLTVVLKDVNGRTLSGRMVTWSSSDQTKATVSGTGVVTGVAAGTVTITATSETKVGTATVTVYDDHSAPNVVSLSVSPASVDVTTGARTVTVTAHIQDAGGSGVSLFYFNASSPTGPYNECSATTPAFGTATDGTFSCTVTIARGASPGDWPIFIAAVDAAGNQRQLGQTELAAAGFPTKFTVVSSNPDKTPPTFTSLTVSPAAVDVRTGARTVTATAHLTDANSGVARFDFGLRAPDNMLYACYTSAPTTGTANDGDWSCTVTIPAQALSGDYGVVVRATDAATYFQMYDSTTGFPSGFPTKVTVTGR